MKRIVTRIRPLGLMAGVALVALQVGTVAAEIDPALERAQQAAREFGGRLQGKLQAAMEQGGPVEAVQVCHLEAPAIAADVMATRGVQLGRVALPGRQRNPEQQAEGWQLAVLQQFGQAVEAGEKAAEQVWIEREELPEGVALRMMRGIALEARCLACHGDAVAPAVTEAIARHYPEDGATGFALGDLRGGLWVEVPVSALQGGQEGVGHE